MRNIAPLFRLLKKKTLAQDILVPTYEIVMMMRNREYVKANDAYLRLSIGTYSFFYITSHHYDGLTDRPIRIDKGNAPWPMGVTMVGIHERSAREKIFSNQVCLSVDLFIHLSFPVLTI